VSVQRTLILSRRQVTGLLDVNECSTAVERAFLFHAEGKSLPPGVLGVPARGGGFHIKAAGLELDRLYFAAKVNGNFSMNPNLGLPAIQGIIVLCDGENGSPLAVMDSIEITLIRTGAATAVAAKRLARKNSKIATICGCGNQGRIQLRALRNILPIERVFLYDMNETQAQKLCGDISGGIEASVASLVELPSAIGQSDVVVTCTPSRNAFLKREWVSPGTFLAAVGADSAEKQELDPTLLSSSRVVVDVLEQCATIGELHHALAAGLMTVEDVHADLSELVAGRKPGRSTESEIIIFDSTGTALQDVAAAALVYEKALGSGIGTWIDMTGS